MEHLKSFFKKKSLLRGEPSWGAERASGMSYVDRTMSWGGFAHTAGGTGGLSDEWSALVLEVPNYTHFQILVIILVLYD